MISGIHNSIETLYRLSDAKSRSICAENPTGEKGKAGMATEGQGAYAARDLGIGWKVSPALIVKGGSTVVLADIKGSGAIQHIWMTTARVAGKNVWKDFIFRIYWDGQDYPSVEVPMGDFFCNGWDKFAKVTSMPVCANPARGFNSYWTMPFRKRALITMENRRPDDIQFYYQIDYTEAEVEEDAAYFCASYRLSRPTEGGIHTILDGIEGRGQYVGTYLAWQVNNNGWWGEGEVKFYMDGDREFPTICGTGTEDYFCGAYNFDVPGQGYTPFSTPYAGCPQILLPDAGYAPNLRFGMYRFHIPDPIRFEKDLRVTIQDLGWHSEGRYHIQKSYIGSVAYWYQTLPTSPLKPLGSRDDIETN